MFSRRIVSAVAAATVVASCSLTTGCGDTAPSTLTTVRVDALPVVDDLALYIARSKGWFRQAGLKVKLSTAATSAVALPHLLSGGKDIVAGPNYVSVIKMIHNGKLPLKVLADGYTAADRTNAVLALPSSGISSRGTYPAPATVFLARLRWGMYWRCTDAPTTAQNMHMSHLR